MSDQHVPTDPLIDFEATVIRCGCGDPQSHASLGQPCPRPRAVEDLGVIATNRPRPSALQRLRRALRRQED